MWQTSQRANCPEPCNKIKDSNCFIRSLRFKPHVIAITEVNSRNINTNLSIRELNLIGYNIHSIESQGQRRVGSNIRVFRFKLSAGILL